MARKPFDAVKTFMSINVRGVNGLHLLMPYISSADVKTADKRAKRLADFLLWAEKLPDFQWNGTAIDRYADHLRSIGNKQNSIDQKTSSVRQFLLAAQKSNVISDCVFYKKRGRKPLHPITDMVFVPRPNVHTSKRPKRSRRPRFKAGYLYDLFGIDMAFTDLELRRSYLVMAQTLHPDRNKAEGSHEKFIACKEAYDYLINNRVVYEMFVKGKLGQGSDDVKSFVCRIRDAMAK